MVNLSSPDGRPKEFQRSVQGLLMVNPSSPDGQLEKSRWSIRGVPSVFLASF